MCRQHVHVCAFANRSKYAAMRGLPMRARSGPYNRQEMKWGVFFCKIVDLFSTHGALCTVSVFLFYILLIWRGGVRTQRTPLPTGLSIVESLQSKYRGWVKKSKLLILSEYVNKTEKIGGM